MAASTLPKPTHHHPVDTPMTTAVFWVGFFVFLVIALVAQMLTMRWRSWLPGAEGEGSLIADVKTAVYTFMAYIP